MSWGGGDGYQRRNTLDHPTKSGVTGLVAGMLGRPRTADISDIAALRYGCAVNKPGTRMDDMQTMGVRADGKSNPLQTKEYLMDADFTIGLEAADDDPLIDRIADAVRHPYYIPYLGRRSCPPAGPIETHVVNQPLEQALQGDGDMYVETVSGGRIRYDHPFGGRRFGVRRETRIPAASCDDFMKALEANQ